MTEEEQMDFLDAIEEVSPCGSMDWADVAKEHCDNGWHDRDPKHLRKKYQSLAKEAFKYKTSNPSISALLRRTQEVAKKVRVTIRAVDPSVEAGGIEAAMMGDAAALCADDVGYGSDITSVSDTSSSNNNKRNANASIKQKKAVNLDGPKPLRAARSKTPTPNPQALMMESFAKVQMANLKAEREQRHHERDQQQRQQNWLMRLVAMGTAAYIGSTNPNASGPLSHIIRDMVDMEKENKKATKEDDRKSERD